jgi:hypothetical protein
MIRCAEETVKGLRIMGLMDTSLVLLRNVPSKEIGPRSPDFDSGSKPDVSQQDNDIPSPTGLYDMDECDDDDDDDYDSADTAELAKHLQSGLNPQANTDCPAKVAAVANDS